MATPPNSIGFCTIGATQSVSKILKNCRKAIAPRDAGGKVIIFDMVIGAGMSDHKHKETQALYDLFIMHIDGVERDEQE
ncbi:hypothetical protein EJB05_36836, partial [Eragrostis curvula]